ncbi:ATP synthase F1 subunit delta [bacterium]|nr:ATP synthase F1 subunit delta [bacterium]
MPGAVAKRYAAALFELALEQGQVEEFDAQAQFLEDLFADPQIRGFFNSPRIPAERKKQVTKRQLADQLSASVMSLVLLLVDKRRIGFLPEIMHEFDELTDKHRGVEEVTIVTAVPLTEAQRQAIVNEVRRFSAYGDLRVSAEVDSGVLGGVKVKLGTNIVIDGTLSSRLNEMRDRMYRYRHRGIGA